MKHTVAMKVSLGYALIGLLWIPLADRFFIIFIGITAILLFALIKWIERSQKLEREELDTYKHIVSASIDAVALVDRDYRYKAISRTYGKMVGKQPEDVVGKRVPDIVGRELFEMEVKPRVERCFAGEEVRYHLWSTRSGGKRRYFHVVHYPHYEHYKKGAIIGYVVSVRDITDMRRMEDKLRQAYKMEAIGTLAGGIAHDFNNILSVILLNAEKTLQQTKKESDLHTSLITILEAGRRASDLVKQILTFSRQSEQALYPVQVHLIIKEVAKFMRASLPTTIEIQTEIESGSLVLADPTQIHQVMMNLCANAGHAMKDSGGRLTVTLNNVDLDEHFTEFHPPLKPGRYAKLSVSDTGGGIPPEIIDRIFDPFFTTKEKGEGTGMGLSVVHGIVESCGGSISVYSEPKQGSVFNVYLPLMNVKAQHALGQPVPIPRGSETVLFVDDEVKLAMAGKQILEKLGYNVIISNSGMEAYEKIRQQPDRFDLVITDLTMPYMTGEEFASKIKELRSNMPIIMITGLNSQTTAEQLKSVVVDKIIMKPLTTRGIAMAIRQVLADKKAD
jgi:PAS domain S-box-containing protein